MYTNKISIRNIISNIIESICELFTKNRKVKEEEQRRKEEEQRHAEYLQRIENTREENRQKMHDIISECPGDGFLLWIKFNCGNIGTEEVRGEIINEQKWYMKNHDSSRCYTRGSGLLCINPAKFGNDPESISKILWESNRLLKGAAIYEWWYGKA